MPKLLCAVLDIKQFFLQFKTNLASAELFRKKNVKLHPTSQISGYNADVLTQASETRGPRDSPMRPARGLNAACQHQEKFRYLKKYKTIWPIFSIWPRPARPYFESHEACESV